MKFKTTTLNTMFKQKSNVLRNNNLFISHKMRSMHKQMERLYEAAQALKGIEGQSALGRALDGTSPQTVKNWESRGLPHQPSDTSPERGFFTSAPLRPPPRSSRREYKEYPAPASAGFLFALRLLHIFLNKTFDFCLNMVFNSPIESTKGQQMTQQESTEVAAHLEAQPKAFAVVGVFVVALTCVARVAGWI